MGRVIHSERIPHVAMTPDRLEAVKTALDILRRDHANYLDGAFSVGYGDEVSAAIPILEAIVNDLESAVDNMKGHH